MVTLSSAADAPVGMPARKPIWYLSEDAVKDPHWRDAVSWPVTPTRLRQLGEDVCLTAIRLAASEADPDRKQLLAVGLGTVVNAFMVLAELAYVAAVAQEDGVEVVTPPVEFEAFVKGGPVTSVTLDRYRNKGVQDVQGANWPFLRTVARTRSWSGTAGLPAALMAGDGWALSHNNLLLQYLQRHRIRAAFHNAANVVADARKSAGGTPITDDAIKSLLTGAISDLVGLCPDLPEHMQQRFADILLARLLPSFQIIARDIAALRNRRGLPSTVWSGTNGMYTTRVVAAEVRRRGGQVNVFDHGGVTGISQILPLTAIVEGCFSTAFHVGTPAWRDLLVRSGFAELLQGLNDPEIRSCEGEPTFLQSIRDDVSSRSRKRVIYVSHPYYGHRQFAIAAMRDPIYMDFQIDLIERLLAEDIDLMLKPHPEGHMGGRSYPLQHMAKTSFERFETHLNDADIFVFDAPTSTTFCEALCTRRPVIFVERTCYPINPQLSEQIAARCTVVKTDYQDGNRLRVDASALSQAIRQAPNEADPSFFRSLLAGV